MRDAGPGLPPAEAAQVFDRFWRADKARTRARGGSGLGMSIVAVDRARRTAARCGSTAPSSRQHGHRAAAVVAGPAGCRAADG